jgi:hypothetical protein
MKTTTTITNCRYLTNDRTVVANCGKLRHVMKNHCPPALSGGRRSESRGGVKMPCPVLSRARAKKNLPQMGEVCLSRLNGW